VLLKYPLNSYLYHYGLKFGLPFQLLRRVADTCDVMRQPGDYIRRRYLARELLNQSVWGCYVSRKSASRNFGPGEIPGLDHLAEIGREIYRRRTASGGPTNASAENNPFAQLLHENDFVDYPEILEIALSRPIMEIMCGYFGTIPRLDDIDLWVTEPNSKDGGDFGSQLFHLDKPDRHYVSLFLNVHDICKENGPLTFLPANATDQVRRKTAYEKCYYLGNGRLSDDLLFQHTDPGKLVQLTGPAGAGGIVDTSECLHCGSRCLTGKRVVFVFRFTLAHKAAIRHATHIAKFYAGSNKYARLFL